MKRLFGVVLCLLMALSAMAQKSTLDNYSGNWTSSASWSDGVASTTTGLPAGNGNYFLNGYISVGTAPAPTAGSGVILGFAANQEAYTFEVNDTLVIYGDVQFNNKAMNLKINGLMIILGNLSMDNKIELASSGNLIISGDFNKTGTQGSYTGSGNVYTDSYSGKASQFVPDASEKDISNDLRNDLPDIYDFVTNNGATPLPVSLLSFDYSTERGAVQLNWTTASEENNDFFTLERSTNGVDFEVINKTYGVGTTVEVQQYAYRDSNPLFGASYYRLSQTDYDGATAKIGFITVFNSHVTEFSIYPLPTKQGDVVTVFTGADDSEVLNLSVYSTSGQLVYTQQGQASTGYLTLNPNFEKGIYIVKLSTGNVVKTTRLVVE